MTDTNELHLPDLTIKSFRGIDELSIPRLGRVTLLAGKNSVGKTTVLEAVQVYAARGVHVVTRGQYPILYSLLQDRDEMTTTIDEEGNRRLLPDWQSLFYGRDTSENACISIGPKDATNHLSITKTVLGGEQTNYFDPLSDFAPTQALRVVYGSNKQVLPWTTAHVGQGTVITRRALREVNREEPPPKIESKFLGPWVAGQR